MNIVLFLFCILAFGWGAIILCVGGARLAYRLLSLAMGEEGPLDPRTRQKASQVASWLTGSRDSNVTIKITIVHQHQVGAEDDVTVLPEPREFEVEASDARTRDSIKQLLKELPPGSCLPLANATIMYRPNRTHA